MAFETRTINILGMTCSGCVKSVQHAITSLDGIDSVDVSLHNNLATVSYDTGSINIEAIVEAIEDAGFDASIANDQT